MTPLENRIRQAFRGEAGDMPPGTVPPLRLPARRRRFLSLAYGGGERQEAPPGSRRGRLIPAAAAVVVAAVIAGSLAVSHMIQAPNPTQAVAAADQAAANEAAAWIEAQVTRSASISCDPMICRVLAAHGLPAEELNELKSGAGNPLRSQIVVATTAVRQEFGDRLSSVYAPAILATFGSGATRIDIRIVAQHGPAAYRSALRTDLQNRKNSGAGLSDSNRIRASAAARRQLRTGQVDARVMITLALLASLHPVSVVAFVDSGPGAGPGVPLRSMELAAPTGATLRKMLAFFDEQRPPYRPARVGVTRLRDGQRVLRVEFAAPSPLGLFK
jgi:hypothetical protein